MPQRPQEQMGQDVPDYLAQTTSIPMPSSFCPSMRVTEHYPTGSQQILPIERHTRHTLESMAPDKEQMAEMLGTLWQRTSAFAEECSRWNHALQEKQKEAEDLADMIQTLSKQFGGNISGSRPQQSDRTVFQEPLTSTSETTAATAAIDQAIGLLMRADDVGPEAPEVGEFPQTMRSAHSRDEELLQSMGLDQSMGMERMEYIEPTIDVENHGEAEASSECLGDETVTLETTPGSPHLELGPASPMAPMAPMGELQDLHDLPDPEGELFAKVRSALSRVVGDSAADSLNDPASLMIPSWEERARPPPDPVSPPAASAGSTRGTQGEHGPSLSSDSAWVNNDGDEYEGMAPATVFEDGSVEMQLVKDCLASEPFLKEADRPPVTWDSLGCGISPSQSLPSQASLPPSQVISLETTPAVNGPPPKPAPLKSVQLPLERKGIPKKAVPKLSRSSPKATRKQTEQTDVLRRSLELQFIHGYPLRVFDDRWSTLILNWYIIFCYALLDCYADISLFLLQVILTSNSFCQVSASLELRKKQSDTPQSDGTGRNGTSPTPNKPNRSQSLGPGFVEAVAQWFSLGRTETNERCPFMSTLSIGSYSWGLELPRPTTHHNTHRRRPFVVGSRAAQCVKVQNTASKESQSAVTCLHWT